MWVICRCNYFRRFLKKRQLALTEWVVAEEGYPGCEFVKSDVTVFEIDKTVDSQIRSRHENINDILKFFNIVNCRFWRDRRLHECCFHALAKILQLSIKHESPLRISFHI